MNVSLTRAKYCLWVVGNSRTLNRSTPWRELINYSHKINCYYRFNQPPMNIIR